MQVKMPKQWNFTMSLTYMIDWHAAHVMVHIVKESASLGGLVRISSSVCTKQLVTRTGYVSQVAMTRVLQQLSEDLTRPHTRWDVTTVERPCITRVNSLGQEDITGQTICQGGYV